MSDRFNQQLQDEIDQIKAASLYKTEYVIQSPQGRVVKIDGKEYINFCSNNYLGLSGSDELAEASDKALQDWGFGLASVRFICGTQQLHKDLEAATTKLLGTEESILYSSCFMANLGLFQTFFGPDDAIISDELNHASIIDAVRLTKSKRIVFKHMDMEDLEGQLKATQDSRFRVIATDGVFSMDGDIAPLKEICDLADKYDALVMVDDAHGVGAIGEHGGGSPEFTDTVGRIDFLTGTYGKALGGAGGAYIGGSKETVEYLRQRSRTYLFSNALDTGVAGAALHVLSNPDKITELNAQLQKNVQTFREKMRKSGFTIPDAQHSITPIMLSEEKLAKQMADKLFDEGIYAVSFSYPVVPKGKARIRVQISAAHTDEDINRAVSVFSEAGRELGVIG